MCRAPLSKYVGLKNEAPKLCVSDKKASKLEATDKEGGVPYPSVNLSRKDAMFTGRVGL